MNRPPIGRVIFCVATSTRHKFCVPSSSAMKYTDFPSGLNCGCVAIRSSFSVRTFASPGFPPASGTGATAICFVEYWNNLGSSWLE